MLADWRGVAPLLGVAVAALALGVWGLDTRDLSGDELHMLRGGVRGALNGAYGPIFDDTRPFWGHLPFSFMLREWSTGFFGQPHGWAWRLHALLAGTLTAVVCADVGRREGGPWAAWLAGAAVVVDPVLGFHVQDAGNYAMSALAGSLALHGCMGGLRGWRGWTWTLGFGLVLGCVNDLWFAIPAAVCALGSIAMAVKAPALRRSLGWVWLAVALPALLAAAVVVVGGGAGDFVLHADVAGHSPLTAPWTVLRRFIGAHVSGYESGRIADFWDAGPAVILVASISAIGAWTMPRLRPTVGWLWTGLLLATAGALAFQVATGRALPIEPRSTLGLWPAWACVLGITAARHRWLGLTLVVPLLATLELRHDTADAQHLLTQAVKAWPGRDVILPAPWGGPAHPMPTDTAMACLPASPGPDVPRLLVATTREDCRPDDCQGAVAPMKGWDVVRAQVWPPPAAERNAASFLPTWALCEWAPHSTQNNASTVIVVNPAWLDGVTGGVTVLSPAQGAPTRVPGAHTVSAAGIAGPVSVSVEPRAPRWMPHWSVFAPYRRSTQSWGPRRVPTDGQVHVQARALQAPWLRVLGRVLLLLLSLGAWAAALWRRR